MKKMVTWMSIAVIAFALTVSATEQQNIKIPSLTSGRCSITLLEADGIKPMAAADVKVIDAKDATKVLASTTDAAGKCVVKLKNGRYVLRVNDRNLTLLDASDNGEMAWCRIVVSDTPMLVGGQEEGEGVTVTGATGATTGQIVFIGAVAFVVIGGIAYAIDDYQPDGDGGTATVTVTDTTPVVIPPTGGGNPPPASP